MFIRRSVISNWSSAFPKNDVHAYLRGLEKVVVNTLKSFGIERAEAKTVSFENSSDTEKPLELTGVWVGDKKIASIGVAIKKIVMTLYFYRQSGELLVHFI